MVTLLSVRTSSATVFFVRAGGSDHADGLSPATAFASIRHAADTLNNPGDQVVVGPGTFDDGDIGPAHSGFGGHPIVFLADVDGSLTGDAAGPVIIMPTAPRTTGFLVAGRHHVVIDGFTVVGATDAAIQVRPDALAVPSNDVTIRNVTARGSAKRGIDIQAGGLITVENCVAMANGSTGISIIGVTGGELTVALSDSEASQNQSHGVFISGAIGGVVSGNQIENNAETGILARSSANLSIASNTVTGSQDGIGAGAGPSLADAVSSVEITRNDVQNNTRAGIDVVVSDAATVDDNTVINSGTGGVTITGSGASAVSVQSNDIESSSADGLLVSGAAPLTIGKNTVKVSNGSGIRVEQSSKGTITDNVIAGSTENGLAVGVSAPTSGGSDFTLLRNQVTTSTKSGITIYATGAVTAGSNAVTHSGATGLSLQSAGSPIIPNISNNILGISGSHGVFVLGSNGGVVQNNVVFSNGDTGITLRTAPDALIVNNLVYANEHDGLALGTNDLAAPRAKILQNTVYHNGGWGLRLGTDQAPSPGAIVVDNIFQLNQGDNMGQGAGIAVARSSTCDYVAGFNINVDGYGLGTPHNDYDIVGDPLFLNPAGPDRQLGGDGFADDDFHLRQGRGGQTIQSPAVDAGAALIDAIGLTGATARGNVPDMGVVDIGYHYGATADQRITVPTPYMPIFVRQAGRQANDGLAPERALPSIQAAAQRADAGGVVIVGPGTYAEGDVHPDQNRGVVTFFGDRTGVLTGDVPGAVLVNASGADTGFVLLNACGATVRGFSVTGAVSAGIQVREGSDDAVARDNVVFSNQRRGIESLGAESPQIDNNLVYANGTGGIHIEQGNNGDITNNTVYANGEVGILVGGSGSTAPALGTSVLRNIVAANGKGMKLQPDSFTGYYTGFNVVPDGFDGNTPRADSDFVPDKSVQLFVDPRGPGGVLAGAGFLDDDFHLVESSTNPARAIDYGVLSALAAGSTSSDGLPNVGPADAGYHYPFLPAAPWPVSTSQLVFVRASGSDRNDGLSPARAFASVERAIERVSGDGLVVIGPGTYHEQRLLVGVAGRGDGVVALLGDEGGQLTGDAAGKVVIDAGGHAAPTVAGQAVIDGLTLTGARGPGLRVLHGAHGVTLRNSTLCGNTGDGVVTSGEAVSIVNNLMCGNGGTGVSVRLRGARQSTQILNNTVAGNLHQGIMIREANASVSRALAYNNVISGNGGVGISARALHHVTPATGNNLNTDGYGAATRPGADDLNVAPQFIVGVPSKTIGCDEAESVYVAATSPAIDHGARTAVEIGLGTRSVTSGGGLDTGPTDIGYHYRQ